MRAQMTIITVRGHALIDAHRRFPGGQLLGLVASGAIHSPVGATKRPGSVAVIEERRRLEGIRIMTKFTAPPELVQVRITVTGVA